MCNGTGRNWGFQLCAGTLRALHTAPPLGKGKGQQVPGLGSSKQGQSFISLQMKAAGVQLLAGAQPCPDTFGSSRMSSLQDLCHRTVAMAGKGAVPSTYLCFLCTSSPSHCPAVLDAALGRNARPGQEAAEEALGLSVYPLGNGARAQAG